MLARLKSFRIALGYDQARMGLILGVKQNTYSQIENGRRQLTENHIRLMEERANLNSAWLRTGKGEMFAMRPDEESKLIELFNALCPANQEYLLKQCMLMLELEQREKDI